MERKITVLEILTVFICVDVDSARQVEYVIGIVTHTHTHGHTYTHTHRGTTINWLCKI